MNHVIYTSHTRDDVTTLDTGGLTRSTHNKSVGRVRPLGATPANVRASSVT